MIQLSLEKPKSITEKAKVNWPNILPHLEVDPKILLKVKNSLLKYHNPTTIDRNYSSILSCFVEGLQKLPCSNLKCGHLPKISAVGLWRILRVCACVCIYGMAKINICLFLRACNEKYSGKLHSNNEQQLKQVTSFPGIHLVKFSWNLPTFPWNPQISKPYLELMTCRVFSS